MPNACLALLNSMPIAAALLVGVVRAAPDDVVQGANGGGGGAAAAEGRIFEPRMAAGPAHAFDQVILPGFPSIAAAHTQLVTRMELYLAMVDRTCQISEEERTKLRLAASTDIKRIIDSAEDLRRRLVNARGGRAELAQSSEDRQTLQSRLNPGPFGESSLVGKTLHNSLNAEQLAKYEAHCVERQREHYRTAIEATLLGLEDVVPMTGNQHDALINLLLTETPPPRIRGPLDDTYVRYQLATLPESSIRAQLDKRQADLLEAQVSTARNARSLLIKQGLIVAGDVEQAIEEAKKLPQNYRLIEE
ncbi:MAG TPA: hypothetical protein VGN12_27230 [Pirellulales bacterium]|jgi:hypothetical protein